MPDYGTVIQKAYIAYFGRPADFEGYNYWLNGLNTNALTVEDMYMHFAASQEYLSNYAGMTNTQIITEVYQNLFDRDPELGGLTYWTTQMNAGWVTIDNVVMAVLGGASNVGEPDLDTINNKVTAAAAFTAALDTVAEINGYSGAEAAAEANEWLAGITDDNAALAAAIAPAALNAAIADVITPDVPAPVDQTLILTAGQDDLTGGAGNDVFRSTQATLQLGDSVDGGAGQDTLTVSISGAGIALNGFAATSVETIEVKSLSTSASVIDLSDVDGLTTLVSRETEGAAMTFQDIQSVNNVDLSIVDTKETHNFIYDVNAYASGVDNDNVDLRLEEIRGAAINFGTVGGVIGKSVVEKITINSQTLVSPDLGKNLVSDLNVGDSLAKVIIEGNADLEVVASLDPFILHVDATALDAKLTLDMSAEDISVPLVTFLGAQDDTSITFGSAANAKSITTYGGDDTIRAGEGNNTIVSGAGNDSITAGSGNDVITSGSGDDTVYAGEGNNRVDAGDNNDSVETGVGNDTVFGGEGNDYLWDLGGNNNIQMGAGNDAVYLGSWDGISMVDGMGNNSIDLGAGNDLLAMDAKELEVADTITGGEGIDTMELYNSTGRYDLGYVMASETQRTTSIEEFDLRDEQIYLTLTDNLIASAGNNSITVLTEDAVGLQTVDITNITAPVYSFTLEGGVNRDIVIADDMTANSMSTMRFDDPAFGGNSIEDTLIVTDAANISATDTLNISGLEKIVLKGNTVWNVDLTDALIEQTTGNATLYIKVDSTVPAGSKLYLNTVGVIDSNTDVVVLRNSNVSVYLDGTQIVADGEVLLFDDLGEGLGSLSVDTPLEFTENADSLVGTAGDDTFYATSPDQLDLSDFADGLGHNLGDRLVLGAGLYAGTSAWQQMNNARLDNIEILEFSEDVNYGVSFADDYDNGDYEFHTYILTAGNDSVTNALSDHTFYLRGGSDTVRMDYGADRVTVDGGLGADVVYMNSGSGIFGNSASLSITEVESVYGDDGKDTVTILDSNTVPVYFSMGDDDDCVNGSANGDVVTVDGGRGRDSVFGFGGNDSIWADDVESINGGEGNDTIVGIGDLSGSDDSVDGDNGDDVITVTDFDSVWGGNGNDTITTQGTDNVTIWGGAGDDEINLNNTGRDTVVFGREINDLGTQGNAGHPNGVGVSVTSGYDVINNFAAGATLLTTQDQLDFTQLLGNAGGAIDLKVANFNAGVDLRGGNADNVAILWNAPNVLDISGGTFFTSAPEGGKIAIDDNGEAVILFTSDVEGDNVEFVTVAYVCDTDAGTGQTWDVTIIGTVNFDYQTGLNAGTLNDNILA